MKQKAHSNKVVNLLHLVTVVCITCNSRLQIRTTLKKDFKIDVCSRCHTFYLGTQKFESKAGRMERFRKLEQKTRLLQKQKKPQSNVKGISTDLPR